MVHGRWRSCAGVQRAVCGRRASVARAQLLVQGGDDVLHVTCSMKCPNHFLQKVVVLGAGMGSAMVETTAETGLETENGLFVVEEASEMTVAVAVMKVEIRNP